MRDLSPQAPAWFRDAVSHQASVGTVDVDGAAIHYRAWGQASDPPVVLVHGAAAHARWWDHVAPLLAADRYVVAPDLSGHGDSGRRPGYGHDQWAREIDTVARLVAGSGRPSLVGHSMGGAAVLQAAARWGHRYRRVVAVDTAVRHPSRAERERAARPQEEALTGYPSQEAILDAFRPMPSHPVLPWITDHVARTSATPTQAGWAWKFDPGIFRDAFLPPSRLQPPACPVTLVFAERGTVALEVREDMASRLGPATAVIELADAGHHAMLDRPRELVRLLAGVLGADPRPARPHGAVPHRSEQ